MYISFSTTLFILVEEIHESCSRGNLETFSQLTSSSQSPLQQKVLKVESLQELDRLSNIPSLSVGLVLVKMTSPYLPASPKIKFEKKLSFNVLLIHQKDWHRVGFELHRYSGLSNSCRATFVYKSDFFLRLCALI